MKWFIEVSKQWCLLFLIEATLYFVWYQQTFFISDILYYNTYGDQLSLETIDSIIGNSKKYAWIGYVLAPFVLLIRITFTALCFYIALFFKNIETSFSSCFNIALKADVSFVFLGLFIIIYQLVVPAENLMDLAGNPLSLIYYLDVESLPRYLLYPIGLINLFEFLYWGLLISLIKYRYKFSVSESFKFVLSSYGVGLMLLALVLTLIIM
jgi:hypothetical protein